MAIRSRTCSRRLESRRRSAFLRMITPKCLPSLLATHRSCCGCIIRFDKTQNFLCREIFCFSSVPILAENRVFSLKAENPIYRFVRSRCIWLPVVALFFVSGRCLAEDPVGDFFKKVGQSISKAFQPQPQPNQPKRKPTKSAPRHSTLPQSNVVIASPTPLEQPTNLVKEEKVTPTVTVMRASGVPLEKAKGDMPYGIPVPDHKGMVTSPYSPEGNYIDVSAFAPGSPVRDPYTGKIFLVP